jgi:large subunit ribosomal protein L9
MLRKKEIVVTARCGERGRLYGSITAQEVADALNAQHHIHVEKRNVELSGPVHTVGEYEASVWLYAGITVPMKVIVKPEA